MKDIEFTAEDVAGYYHGDFARDLSGYFEIEGPHSYRDYSMVLFMDRVKGFAGSPTERVNRLGPPFYFSMGGSRNVPHNFVFAGIVLHMILVSQSLRANVGMGAAEDFHRASGWPLFSAGMAGSDYDAMKMIAEAHLAPNAAEVDNFKKMLQVVSPFMLNELGDFLRGASTANINTGAYMSLKTAVAGKTDDVLSWIASRVDEVRLLEG